MKIENGILLKWILLLSSVLLVLMAGKTVIVKHNYTNYYFYTYYRTERAIYKHNPQLRRIVPFPSANHILTNQYEWNDLPAND